ncbi:hypothetical protein NP233_g5236 [Leucocoprinus birnbaumii]|uniref:Uncharacterized protein n=1 Tax=Leucocoprinus birnbaumii TaxID=56174 RepID=A0AAD5VZK7_9AGAR|nr:hypothetical protein NP233_g5236 [Leucocoprinus birnbaumii]
MATSYFKPGFLAIISLVLGIAAVGAVSPNVIPFNWDTVWSYFSRALFQFSIVNVKQTWTYWLPRGLGILFYALIYPLVLPWVIQVTVQELLVSALTQLRTNPRRHQWDKPVSPSNTLITLQLLNVTEPIVTAVANAILQIPKIAAPTSGLPSSALLDQALKGNMTEFVHNMPKILDMMTHMTGLSEPTDSMLKIVDAIKKVEAVYSQIPQGV